MFSLPLKATNYSNSNSCKHQDYCKSILCKHNWNCFDISHDHSPQYSLTFFIPQQPIKSAFTGFFPSQLCDVVVSSRNSDGLLWREMAFFLIKDVAEKQLYVSNTSNRRHCICNLYIKLRFKPQEMNSLVCLGELIIKKSFSSKRKKPVICHSSLYLYHKDKHVSDMFILKYQERLLYHSKCLWNNIVLWVSERNVLTDNKTIQSQRSTL